MNHADSQHRLEDHYPDDPALENLSADMGLYSALEEAAGCAECDVCAGCVNVCDTHESCICPLPRLDPHESLWTRLKGWWLTR